MEMQQIQVTLQTPTDISLHVESNQILIVNTILNTVKLCDFNRICGVLLLIAYCLF